MCILCLYVRMYVCVFAYACTYVCICMRERGCACVQMRMWLCTSIYSLLGYLRLALFLAVWEDAHAGAR